MSQEKYKFHILVVLNDGTTVSLGEIDTLPSVVWIENKKVVASFTNVEHNPNGETYYIFKEVDAIVMTAKAEEVPDVVN